MCEISWTLWEMGCLALSVANLLKEIEISFVELSCDYDCIYSLIGVAPVVQGVYCNYWIFFSRKPPLQLIDILYSGDTVAILLYEDSL